MLKSALKNLVCSVILAVLCWSAAAADCSDRSPGPILLGMVADTLPTSRQLLRHVYRDGTGALDLADIIALDRAGKFSDHCAAHVGIPGKGTLWVRIDAVRVGNAPQSWALVPAPFEIDEFRTYRLRSDQAPAVQRSGRAVPAPERSRNSRWPATTVEFSANDTARLYLSFTSKSKPDISLKFIPTATLDTRDRQDLIVLSAFFGFMAAMFFVNVLLYHRGRHIQSVYYCLYLIFITVHVFIYDGPLYQLSPIPIYGGLADSLAQASGILAGLALPLCGRVLLRLPERMPRTNRAVLLIAALMLMALAAEIAGILPYALTSSICLGTLGLVMVGSALIQAVRGSRPAVYFLLSYLALMSVFIVEFVGFFYPDTDAGYPLHVSLLENWSFHMGICVETILIAFALSYFIRDMEGQVETVRRELETTAHKAGVRVRVEGANPDSNPTMTSDEAFFERALSVAQTNLGDRTFGLDQLAAALAVSPRTLRRRIDTAAGLTPHEVLRFERLERGRRLLEAGSFNSVAEVAHAVGIPNANYFTRVFRDRYGHTPWSILKKPDDA